MTSGARTETFPPRAARGRSVARAAGALALALAALAGPARGGDVAAAPPPQPPSADDAVVSALSAGLPAEARADLAFLRHLGWRFVRDPALKAPEMRAGTPCFRRDLEAARAAGDLTVALPAAMTPEQTATFGASLAPLVETIESRCAWKQRYAVAAREATRKLSEVAARGDYTFPKILFVNSPVFRCTLPKPEWRKIGVENVCTGSTAKAIEAVYGRGGVAECYTGQWVAIFATQYEMYGPEWFDQEFRAEEVRLGRPREATQTALGAYVDESKSFTWRALVIPEARMREDAGLVLAELGPKAFAGITGIIQNEDEDGGANQNVMIVSISPRAVDEIRTKGGLRRFFDLTREANEARLASRKGLSRTVRQEHERHYQEVLADPLLSETMIYVQPFGVVPFSRIAHKEMEEDGKALKLRLYTNGLEEYLYRRYRNAWRVRWARENGVTIATPPPPAPPGPAAGSAPPPPPAPVPAPSGPGPSAPLR